MIKAFPGSWVGITGRSEASVYSRPVGRTGLTGAHGWAEVQEPRVFPWGLKAGDGGRLLTLRSARAQIGSEVPPSS